METVWKVGDCFYAEKPVFSGGSTKTELLANNRCELAIFELKPSDADSKIINNPRLYDKELYYGLSLYFRERGYQKWKKLVQPEKVWDPEGGCDEHLETNGRNIGRAGCVA